MEKVLESMKSLATQSPTVETMVDAAMGVGIDQIDVLVPRHGTPVKSSTKAGSRAIPRSYKIVGVAIVAIVAIGGV